MKLIVHAEVGESTRDVQNAGAVTIGPMEDEPVDGLELPTYHVRIDRDGTLYVRAEGFRIEFEESLGSNTVRIRPRDDQ